MTNVTIEGYLSDVANQWKTNIVEECVVHSNRNQIPACIAITVSDLDNHTAWLMYHRRTAYECIHNAHWTTVSIEELCVKRTIFPFRKLFCFHCPAPLRAAPSSYSKRTIRNARTILSIVHTHIRFHFVRNIYIYPHLTLTGSRESFCSEPQSICAMKHKCSTTI